MQMKKNYPDPDIGAPGVQSHIASATDFTGIAQNLAHANDDLADLSDNIGLHQDPYVANHLTERMQEEKKNRQN